MKKQVISLFLAFGISLVAGAQPQEKRRAITLEEAITIARVQSVDAAVALNELKTAYWEYRTFRADLLPEMNFEATIPSYIRSIILISRITVLIHLYVIIIWK